MRKLVSIQKVAVISSIEGADRIELVHVLGWQCVANKGQFKESDKCVYFEVDSFLPVKDEYEFLRASSYKKSDFMGEGFKLRTMKFKGQISQGLVLPLSVCGIDENTEIGTDVTEQLGVREYMVPEQAGTIGTTIAPRPGWIIKTDETRIQSLPALLDEFGDKEYYITTKMDDTSCSIGLNGEEFVMTGHNYQFKPGEGAFPKYIQDHNIEALLRDYADELGIKQIVVQGEFCGAGIQKNRLKLNELTWFIFNVYIDGDRKNLDTITEVAKALDNPMVPVQEHGVGLKDKYPTVEALLQRAEGQYPNGGQQEGIVIRPCQPVYSNNLSGSLSMKVINNKYILKNDD